MLIRGEEKGRRRRRKWSVGREVWGWGWGWNWNWDRGDGGKHTRGGTQARAVGSGWGGDRAWN